MNGMSKNNCLDERKMTSVSHRSNGELVRE